PKKYYSEQEIQQYIHKLVQGRRKFTEEVAEEGLRDEVLWAAERSFRIDEIGKKSKVFLEKGAEEEAEKEKPKEPFELKTRPKRGGFWRHR
ncbi:MAG: hypothetical protein ACLFVG_10975, partial [Candidatus Aminicenantes bacterium]